MIRNTFVFLNSKCLGRRRNKCLLPLVAWAGLSLVMLFWLGDVASRALTPPSPPDQNLQHYRRSRDLNHYLDNIQILIEPSSVACGEHDEVPVLILVTSAPSHQENRQAIRRTWGTHQPTYFLLGIEGHAERSLADNYIEAKEHSDMIIYDMLDHYQNLTLKTMIMLKWTLDRCSRAQFLLKTDDDVLVNPWTLKKVLEENIGAKLIGYRITKINLHRDEYTKWYVPRWLCSTDLVPEYLSGTGYLINGHYLHKIFEAAKRVPLINLEDVYLTHLVSKAALKLDLTHDKRLSPFKPWVPLDCAYYRLALLHSLSPDDLVHTWPRIERIAADLDGNVCRFYNKYIDNDLLLY